MTPKRPLKVLVTGGSRGIGRAIADRFRQSGHDVTTPARADLDLAEMQQVVDYCKTGSLVDFDVLINNAGENEPLALQQIKGPEFQRILAVNVTAPFMLARFLGVAMAEKGWGRIVNIGSVYGLVSRERRSMYSTTKSALNGMTRALAVELGPRNVLVNTLCPGFVDTDLTRQNNTEAEIAKLCESVPLRRLADPREIAETVFFLGSEFNSYITGQAIVIDGGFVCQ